MTTRTTVVINGMRHEIDEAFLARVLETAVEGACSYWADVSAESSEESVRNEGKRDFDLSDYIEDEVDADRDEEGAIAYTEASFLVSKDPAQGGTLDLQGVADAIERIVSGEVEVPPAIREIILAAVEDGDASDIDAEAADCIVQVGLFDEIVYG